MRQILKYFFFLFLISCNNNQDGFLQSGNKKITDSVTNDLSIKKDDMLSNKSSEKLICKAPVIGEKIENFIGVDTAGIKYSLDDFPTDYILLEIGHQFCKYCWEAIPDLNEVQVEYKNVLSIVGINLIINKEQWIEKLKEENITWITLMDIGNMVTKPVIEANCIKSYPTYILLNSDYVIIDKRE